jgi:hypothetical protein
MIGTIGGRSRERAGIRIVATVTIRWGFDRIVGFVELFSGGRRGKSHAGASAGG